MIVFFMVPGKLFAPSCHGGGGGGHSGYSEKHEKYQPEQKKESVPIKVIEIKAPPKMTIKGTLTCPGNFLFSNRKGYWHDDDEKCKNSAI